MLIEEALHIGWEKLLLNKSIMSFYHFHFHFFYSYPCCYSVINSIHIFILHRLAVLFAYETEDGCRSSETCISNLKTVCSYLKIISCLLLFRKSYRGFSRQVSWRHIVTIKKEFYCFVLPMYLP